MNNDILLLALGVIGFLYAKEKGFFDKKPCKCKEQPKGLTVDFGKATGSIPEVEVLLSSR